MSDQQHHAEAEARATDLSAWWHRLGCARCRASRRDALRLRRLMAALPSSPPPRELMERLQAEFRARYAADRGVPGRGIGTWERIAGGTRGWWWATAAVLLAALPALAGGQISGASSSGAQCTATESASGLVLAVAFLGLTRGLASRGALVAMAAVGATLADGILGLRCAEWFDAPHVLAFHLSGVALAIVATAMLRPLRRST